MILAALMVKVPRHVCFYDSTSETAFEQKCKCTPASRRTRGLLDHRLSGSKTISLARASGPTIARIRVRFAITKADVSLISAMASGSGLVTSSPALCKPAHVVDKETKRIELGPGEGHAHTASLLLLHGFGDNASGWYVRVEL